MGYVVVDQQWKLVTNKEGSYCELYDIAADPYEQNDLKDSQADAVASLKQKLSQWKSELPAKPDESCFSRHRK